jgi:hypothetical protein
VHTYEHIDSTTQSTDTQATILARTVGHLNLFERKFALDVLEYVGGADSLTSTTPPWSSPVLHTLAGAPAMTVDPPTFLDALNTTTLWPDTVSCYASPCVISFFLIAAMIVLLAASDSSTQKYCARHRQHSQLWYPSSQRQNDRTRALGRNHTQAPRR